MGVALVPCTHTFVDSVFVVQTNPSCTHDITYVGDEDWTRQRNCDHLVALSAGGQYI